METPICPTIACQHVVDLEILTYFSEALSAGNCRGFKVEYVF